MTTTPPYQEETGSENRQAKPIYPYFVLQAKALSPNYISMITPSRWFAGGMGLDAYRLDMMADKKIDKIIDFTNAKSCFPQISISGGVSYFLRSNASSSNCEFFNIHGDKVSRMLRPLDEFPVLVRYNEAVSILRKVRAQKEDTVDTIISSISPYGLSTKVRGVEKPDSINNVKMYSSQGCSYISLSEVEKKDFAINTYRTLISQTSAEHAGEPSKDGAFRVLTRSMTVMEPGDVCTHSYIYAGSFESRVKAINLLNYLKGKFARLLILQALTSIHLSKSTFIFVPIQDFSKTWTDEKLYAKYNLSDEEIAFIDSMIKPME